MVFEVCMPARCWMAPEMPLAMYSCGETDLPVWPTWLVCGYQPASTAAREAPTAAPRESASASMIEKFSALATPRPPDTTIEASVSSGRDDFCSTDRKSTRLNSSHANISYAVFCLKKKIYHAPKANKC